MSEWDRLKEMDQKSEELEQEKEKILRDWIIFLVQELEDFSGKPAGTLDAAVGFLQKAGIEYLDKELPLYPPMEHEYTGLFRTGTFKEAMNVTRMILLRRSDDVDAISRAYHMWLERKEKDREESIESRAEKILKKVG